MRIMPDLESALDGCHSVYAASSRVGGWRKTVLLPEQAARRIQEDTSAGRKVGLVFGPEDKGLNNREIEVCGPIVSIPTVEGAASLNISQAVLVILYECFKLAPLEGKRRLPVEHGRFITHAELHKLFGAMKSALEDIDFLKRENADYFMMPLKRFMNRLALREHEYKLLMGICRQIGWLARSKAGRDGSGHED
jgi:tRNA/rRNA methyltransferase